MNKIYLIGNLSTDVEKNVTQSGISYCRFSLAVSRRGSNRENNEADFFNIVCWRALADICSNNLSKGRKVCVVGSIQIRKYTAQDGTQRQSVEVTAEDVEFLSPRQESAGQSANSSQPVPQLQEETETDEELPF